MLDLHFPVLDWERAFFAQSNRGGGLQWGQEALQKPHTQCYSNTVRLLRSIGLLTTTMTRIVSFRMFILLLIIASRAIVVLIVILELVVLLHYLMVVFFVATTRIRLHFS
ncbi:hypothetical protein Pfo_031410, partial [Paulownia fortunei]